MPTTGWRRGWDRRPAIRGGELDDMRSLLGSVVDFGHRTQRRAVDPRPSARPGRRRTIATRWFIGYAGDLVVGVWIGNDDNSPNPGCPAAGCRRGCGATSWSAQCLAAAAPVVEEPIDGDNEMTLEDVFEGVAVGDFWYEGSGVRPIPRWHACRAIRLPPDDEGIPPETSRAAPPRGTEERREDTGELT
jgi:penicillin-binding protein 1A